MAQDSSAVKPVEGRRYRGVSNEQRKIERRLKLIEAGIKRFGVEGFHATTVRTICSEAGLTERYFYESFTNAEHLFSACYLSLVETLRHQVFEVFAKREGNDLEQTIRACLYPVFALMKDNPPAARLLLIEVLAVSRDMEALSLKALGDFNEILKAFVGKSLGAEVALKPGIDLDLISSGLIGATLHMAGRWAMDGYQQSTEQVVDNCTCLYLNTATSLRA